jgi:hypothetical protein
VDYHVKIDFGCLCHLGWFLGPCPEIDFFGTLGDESLPLAQHQCFVPSPFVENHRFRVAGLARELRVLIWLWSTTTTIIGIRRRMGWRTSRIDSHHSHLIRLSRIFQGLFELCAQWRNDWPPIPHFKWNYEVAKVNQKSFVPFLFLLIVYSEKPKQTRVNKGKSYGRYRH